jgi:hypothetical protein
MFNIVTNHGKANQSCNKIPYLTCEDSCYKKANKYYRGFREPLNTVSGNAKCCICYGKQYGGTSKNKKELLYDGFVVKRIDVRISNICLYAHVHCNIIYNSQNMGKVQMNIDR